MGVPVWTPSSPASPSCICTSANQGSDTCHRSAILKIIIISDLLSSSITSGFVCNNHCYWYLPSGESWCAQTVAMPIKSNNSFERSKHHQEHHCQSSSQKSVKGAEASKAASRPW